MKKGNVTEDLGNRGYDVLEKIISGHREEFNRLGIGSSAGYDDFALMVGIAGKHVDLVKANELVRKYKYQAMKEIYGEDIEIE